MPRAELSPETTARINGIIESKYTIDEPFPLQLGECVAFPGFTEFHTFESGLQRYIDHHPDIAESWQTRARIQHELWPPKQIGKFGGVILTVISLEDFFERSTRSFRNALSDVFIFEAFKNRAHAFTLDAEIVSSREGVIGGVSTYLAYAPLPLNISVGKKLDENQQPLTVSASKAYSLHPTGMRRLIDKPIIAGIEHMRRVREQSIASAYALERFRLGRPFQAGTFSKS